MTNRIATVERKTLETSVQLTLNLDGRGEADISTGLPFLDHMLRHVSVHGLIDLQIRANGDLDVDAHHTVEDVAIAMGSALDQSLGQRDGITRVGSSYVPMDEALAFVVIDLGGRGYAVVDADFSAPMLRTVATSMFPHFFESLAANARMNLHARVLYGRDDHHKAEALFKALGRALAEAARLDPRRQINSTKGSLA